MNMLRPVINTFSTQLVCSVHVCVSVCVCANSWIVRCSRHHSLTMSIRNVADRILLLFRQQHRACDVRLREWRSITKAVMVVLYLRFGWSSTYCLFSQGYHPLLHTLKFNAVLVLCIAQGEKNQILTTDADPSLPPCTYFVSRNGQTLRDSNESFVSTSELSSSPIMLSFLPYCFVDLISSTMQ